MSGEPNGDVYRALERAAKYSDICADGCGLEIGTHENMRDILKDLRHYAVQQGIDFDRAVVESEEVLRTYYVAYTSDGIDQFFKCQAENEDHAREQCLNAEPTAVIRYVQNETEFYEDNPD
jgi:hypothetical protein